MVLQVWCADTQLRRRNGPAGGDSCSYITRKTSWPKWRYFLCGPRKGGEAEVNGNYRGTKRPGGAKLSESSSSEVVCFTCYTHTVAFLFSEHTNTLQIATPNTHITHSLLSSSHWFLKYREHVFYFVPWSSPPQEHAGKFFGYVWQPTEDAGWHSAYPVISTINAKNICILQNHTSKITGPLS